jgi:serine/threonine protein kinase
MTPERHNRITELFHRALELPEPDRAGFLSEACAGDEELGREVEGLLALDERAADFIETPNWVKSFGISKTSWEDGKSHGRFCPRCSREFPASERVCPEDHERLSLQDPYHLIGQTLAEKFQIEALVGVGGMGAVYSAVHLGLSRRVAFKILLPHLAMMNERMTGLFEQEAKMIGQLSHPYIADIFDAGHTPDGIVYMVMEWLEGRTLEDELHATGAQPLARVTEWIKQIAAALEVAHDRRIIHCDLKPANLMLVRAAEGCEIVKILDFGISKILEKAAGHPVSIAMGTPHYASPEQFQVGRMLDPRSDIYSLGVILYQMLTGDLPFQATSVDDLSRRQRIPPPLVNTLRPELSEQLGALINDMLAHDPKGRPKNIRELLTRFTGKTASRVSVKSGSQAGNDQPIGRPEIGAQLTAALRSMESGRGLLICVTGEAGMGKTTVVDHFYRAVSRSPRSGRIGRGRCREKSDDASPFSPLIESVEELVRGSDLEKRLELLAPSWYALLAGLRAKQTSRPDFTPGSRECMKRELRTFLQSAAHDTPLVLFLEDLHWADLSTIDALAFLGARLDLMKMMVVATYTPSELTLTNSPFLRVKLDLQTHGACREIKLRAFNLEEIESYLAREFAGHEFPNGFAVSLFEHTEGSPLFLAALLGQLRDREILILENGRWRLMEHPFELGTELSPAVEELIRRKTSRLQPEDERMLAAAAALGFEFDSASLSNALGQSMETVEERLEALDSRHSLVRLLGEAEAANHIFSSQYRFVHRMYRTYLHQSGKV